MPKFSDLGKSVKDLMKDDFEDAGSSSLEYKFKTAKGVDIKFEGSKDDKGAVSFKNETKFSAKGVDFKEVFETDGSIKLEASTKQAGKGTKLTGEVVMTTAFGVKDSTFKGEYTAMKNFATTFKYVNGKKCLTADGVFTYENFNIGVTGTQCFGKDDKPKLDFGVAYNGGDTTMTTKLTGGSDVEATVFYAPAGKVTTGLKVNYSTTGSATKATIAAAYEYDKSTSAKFKLNSSQALGLAFTHQLRDEITLGLSADVNLADQRAEAIGVSLKFC